MLGLFMLADIAMAADIWLRYNLLDALQSLKDHSIAVAVCAAMAIPAAMFLGEIIDTLGHRIFDEALFRKDIETLSIKRGAENRGAKEFAKQALDLPDSAFLPKGESGFSDFYHKVMLARFSKQSNSGKGDWALYEMRRNGSIICSFTSIIVAPYLYLNVSLPLSFCIAVFAMFLGTGVFLGYRSRVALNWWLGYLVYKCVVESDPKPSPESDEAT